MFEAGFLEGKSHKLGHGLTEEIPYFKSQERLTFARCGITDPLSIEDYRKHGGFEGLSKALRDEADRHRRRGDDVGPQRPRRRRFPDRHQVEDGLAISRPTRNTSPATPMKATAAPLPTAC